MVAYVHEVQHGLGIAPGAHVIAEIEGKRSGPLFIAIGGLHGNEGAGVLAARRLAPLLGARAGDMAGKVLLLAGNTRALAVGRRFVDADLNRHFTPYFVETLRARHSPAQIASEDDEVVELLAVLDRVLGEAKDEVYVLDMHTTSAEGTPFATLGDTLRNRAFAEHVPTRIILGIEEQLDGTLLEYLNNLGCVTLGFEAGQHTSTASVARHEALVWLLLVAAGVLRREDVPSFEACQSLLERSGGGMRFVEVRHRHGVRPGDDFRMRPGFANFDRIERGQVLAHDWRGDVRAPEGGMILMPLYQPQGSDGFFVARKVRRFWLELSKLLRTSGVAGLADRLPGVRALDGDTDTLIVDTRLARLYPLQIFHLLGFRRRRSFDGLLMVSRRRYDRRGPRPGERPSAAKTRAVTTQTTQPR